jgi:transposase
MKLNLTEEEVQNLKQLHREQKDGKKRDRIKAILMLYDGYTAQEIAKVLLLNENTITGWKKRYLNRKDAIDWLANQCVGYQGKLSACEEKALESYVETSLINDSKQIQVFIRQEFGKNYSKSGVIELLHRLKFTYKQTTLIPSKHDPEKQAEFKRLYDEFIVNLKQDETCVFMDGVHPQHNTKCSHAWVKIGKEKQIKSNSGRRRLNIEGAYNPETQDIIFNDVKTISSENIIINLKKIETFYPNKATIYAICDGAGYYHSEEVKDYLKTSRIEIIKLPAYSPNLNLIERLWKLMRKKKINNFYYEKFKDFKGAVFDFLSNDSEEFKEELKQFIGYKLHLLKVS